MATKLTTKKKANARGPQTMEELLREAKQQPKGVRRGEMVTGKVTEVAGKTVYVDIGGKAEAVVSEQEWELNKDYLKSLKSGDEVTGMVVVAESDAGQVVISMRRAAAESKWKKFEEAMAAGEILTARGREATKGGVLVEVDGVIGFVPGSQLSAKYEGDMGTMAGQDVQVKVIEVDREQNRLVFSERAVSEAEEIEKRKKMLEAVKMGGTYEGTVVGIVPFGAFVEIDVKKEKIEGLVHVSEISWEKVEDVTRFMKEGDKVSVQVIGVDEENGKLALSIKRLTDDPWTGLAKKYAVDSKHKGTVVKMAPYGVLVRLDKGIEGLIHASKMPAGMAFAEGQEVEVFVESVDLEKRRLSLGVVLTEKPVGYK